jgi:NADP-dependent 3-hydroxy acid dehydrogenase YdfG
MSKVGLIRGSSRGFGWELARAVLDSGDQVVATARRPEQLESLLLEYGDRVRTVVLDVTDAEAETKTVHVALGDHHILHFRVG